MPEILRRENKKLEEAMANGTHVKGVGLDTARPWNHCWSLLLTIEVKEWWTENFKDHTTLILTGVKTIGQFLAGDANITGSIMGRLPSTAGDNDLGGMTDEQTRRTTYRSKGSERSDHEARALHSIQCGYVHWNRWRAVPSEQEPRTQMQQVQQY